MKMYPDDWRNRVFTAVMIAAFMAVGMTFGPMLGIGGFWPTMLAVVVAIVVGNLLGQRLFRPSSGGPPDHPPSA
jgi:L-cystine uptake protein TcyP (sodium:dicarboxylate symporter family)